MDRVKTTTPGLAGIYQRLKILEKEFRLLVVFPGHFDDDIVCRLESTSLLSDDSPSYETISYCWGDASQRAQITLDGHLIDAPASSAAAIRRMRWKTMNRILWLDAICINQTDILERNSQVTLMAAIYRQAAGNLIYLGEDDQNLADTAMHSLQKLSAKVAGAVSLLPQDDREAYQEDDIEPDLWQESDLISYDDLQELLPLYRLPWFSRLWVVQEATLARSNLCHWGEATFVLKDILVISSLALWTGINAGIYTHANADNKGVVSASNLNDFMRSSIHNQSDMALNWRLIYKLSVVLSVTDTRDHVYGVLGLVQHFYGVDDTLPRLVQPDYRKSALDVFRDATRFALWTEDDELLAEINHCREEDLLDRTTPSWTVDWDYDPATRSSADMLERSQAGVSAGTEALSRLQIGKDYKDDPGTLRVLGFLLGPITSTEGPVDASQWANAEPLRNIVAFIQSNVCKSVSQPNPQELEVATMSILLCNQLAFAGNRVTSIVEATRGLRELLGIVEVATHTVSTGLSALARSFLRLFVDVSSHRTFFATGRYVGSGPKLTREDDMLLIMKGGKYVHVVRPEEDHFLLVGVAHVLGLMDGEVFESGVEPQWVDLQ